MITSWEQRSRRDRIVVKKIAFPIPLVSPSVFVDRIREAITPRTRVIEIPQITNMSGQVLPVRDVVRLGREKGIQVFVDRAHAVAHLPFKREDLECDFFGCSLHKWLLAPIGTGFLYVRKSKQKSIWPRWAPTRHSMKTSGSLNRSALTRLPITTPSKRPWHFTARSVSIAKWPVSGIPQSWPELCSQPIRASNLDPHR